MGHLCGFRVVHSLLCSGVSTVLFGVLSLVVTLSSYAEEIGKTKDARQETADSSDWIFDEAPYTNSPKTGQRVWQYKTEKTPYRDPYSEFDSPGPGFPFEFDDYDSFFFGYPYYYGMWPFYDTFLSPYFNKNDPEELFPYDGDPND
jgi:hypothetical protein